MKIFELSIGQEDYANMHVARLTILDVSITIGHSRRFWFMFEFDINWDHGFCFCRDTWPKRIPGEAFLTMLVRRFAPGWIES